MPTAKINLQTHDSVTSFDSFTPSTLMIDRYKKQGFDAVGFVGHGERAQVTSNEMIIFNGVEIEVREKPEIHIVKFPDMGFWFLAHPMRDAPDRTPEDVQDIVDSFNLDGVEKFTNGVEYDVDEVDAVKLANDDAHNVFQVGTSFMEVEVDRINRRQIVAAVKRGDIELFNGTRRIVGQAIKKFTVATGTLTRL